MTEIESPPTEYRFIERKNMHELVNSINDLLKDGWEVYSMDTSNSTYDGDKSRSSLLVKKERSVYLPKA